VSRSGFAVADETEIRVWNGIAARLFLSPRTVQARLSHSQNLIRTLSRARQRFVHDRTVFGFATKMRKTSPPF
jgi:hypothetical protein